eukprot:5733420-Pleurochrysis_carterae.AAC.1
MHLIFIPFSVACAQTRLHGALPTEQDKLTLLRALADGVGGGFVFEPSQPQLFAAIVMDFAQREPGAIAPDTAEALEL